MACLFSVLPSPIKSTCEAIRLLGRVGVGGGGGIRAFRSLPCSHWLTLSSLHAVIGSMLGVLLQSLLQFPAVLADFYLSGLLEGEKTDADLEPSDDESFFFPQVQVRVAPLPANGAELSASVDSRDPSLNPYTPTTTTPPLPPPYLKACWWSFITSFIDPCAIKSKAAQGNKSSVKAGGGGAASQATPVVGRNCRFLWQ